jgi:hypothetical protein
MKFIYAAALLMIANSAHAAETASSVTIPAGAVIDCLPYPSIETLKSETRYENGKPAFDGVVTCTVGDGQSVPKYSRFVGKLISGPVANSFAFAWEGLQYPGTDSVKLTSADGELLYTLQTKEEHLKLTFKRALNVPAA